MKAVRRWASSLNQRVLLFFLIVTIIPVAVVGWLSVTNTRRLLEDEVQERQLEITELTGRQLSQFVDEITAEVEQFGFVLRHIALDSAEHTDSRDYADLVQPLSEVEQLRFSVIRLFDTDGNEIAHVEDRQLRPVSTANFRAQETFWRPMRGETFYSTVRLSNGVPTIDLSLPLYLDGTIVGVVAAQISLADPWNVIATQKVGREGYALLVDRRGNVIAAPAHLEGRTLSLINTEVMRNILADDTRREVVEYDSPVGDAVLGSAIPIEGPTWFIITERPRAEAFSAYDRALRNALLGVMGALGLAFPLAYIMSRQVTRPIRDLSGTARAIIGGNLSATAQVRGTHEISELAQAFNTMTTQLRTLIDTLEERVAQQTRDLRVAADVSRQTTRLLNLEELLAQLAGLTRDGFDLYHVGVFLYDAEEQHLTLAASSHAAQQKELVGLHLKVDDPTQPSVVARAAHERHAVIVNDVQKDPTFLKHPLLPDTRSELALPLVVGNKLIGVLNLEARQLDRFGEAEVRVMTSLADQFSIAIQNASLYAEQVRLTEELLAIDVMKNQFMASVSHELRTPLNAVINFTEFVASGLFGTLNDEQANLLRKSIDSAEHLLNLINDVLDITRIEAGMMELFIEQDVRLQAELEIALGIATTLLGEKPVTLSAEVASNLPQLVGDKRRIRQILINLLSNAVKFTDTGRVTLRAAVEDDEIVVTVEDTGSGIAPEDYPLIFESFRQARRGLQSGAGTGLGLAISKKLAEAHEGRLWFESEVGKGTTFHLALPIQSPTLVQQVYQP